MESKMSPLVIKMSWGGSLSAKRCKDFPVVLFITVPWTHCIEAVRFWNTTEILGRRKPWHIHLLECQWVSWLSSWEIPLLLCYGNGSCLLQLSGWLHKGTISIVTDIIFLTSWTFHSQGPWILFWRQVQIGNSIWIWPSEAWLLLELKDEIFSVISLSKTVTSFLLNQSVRNWGVRKGHTWVHVCICLSKLYAFRSFEVSLQGRKTEAG